MVISMSFISSNRPGRYWAKFVKDKRACQNLSQESLYLSTASLLHYATLTNKRSGEYQGNLVENPDQPAVSTLHLVENHVHSAKKPT